MQRRHSWFCAAALMIAYCAAAQEVSILSNNAASLKWSQIRTPNFRILFPRGFDSEAQRVANTLESIREPEAASMGVKPKRISILLQNQTSISNGFVTLAPRRSEFFTMPPQDYNHAGANDWLDLLAVHEYRHIVQFQRSVVGFNKLVYYAFGQQALSMVAYVAAPQWFWEGDAVAAETAFTASGRGRIPQFDLLLRTNVLEGRTFNYHKQYLRSYKHNISDHYVLGYHMVSYLRKKTNDAAIWERIVKRSWSMPFIPLGFSRSLRKESGLGVNGLYKEMAASVSEDWRKAIDASPPTGFQPMVTRSSKAYTDYLYPQVLDDGRVVAMKSGIGDISQLVVIKEGKPETVHITAPQNSSGMLSQAAGRVVWNEFRYDPRWRMRTYSVVKAYDLATGKPRALTKRSRFSSAALSPDGSRVATVETTPTYESRLVILDYSTGKVLKAFADPGRQLISMPRWSSDGASIVALRLSPEGKCISRFDPETGEATDLTERGNENVGHPVLFKHYLFYNSPFSGIDNIYVLDTQTQKKYRITSSKHGAYNPSVSTDGEWIYYNEQTKDGMDVVRAPLQPSSWTALEEVKVTGSNDNAHLVEQEGHPSILKSVAQTTYEVTPYRKWSGLIKPHSWGPFFTTASTNVDVGISSRDLLSTTVINAAYQFDIFERTGFYKAGLSYQGFYPVFDVEFNYGNRQLLTGINSLDIKFTWKETGVNGSVRLPLILTRSRFLTSLELKNTVGITQVEDFRYRVSDGLVLLFAGTNRHIRIGNDVSYIFPEHLANGMLRYNATAVTLAHSMRMSRRDINPRWGLQLDVENYMTPFGGDYNGSLAAARGVFYLPGLIKHHSLTVRAGFQDGYGGYEANRYSFRSRVFRPRGFSYPRDRRFTSVSVNYTFPLWYPDLALGPLVNIQRIRLNPFFDYGMSEGRNYAYHNDGSPYVPATILDRAYQSVGAEVRFDINVMRLLPQLDIGVRFNYGISHKEDLMFEFLIGGLNF